MKLKLWTLTVFFSQLLQNIHHKAFAFGKNCVESKMSIVFLSQVTLHVNDQFLIIKKEKSKLLELLVFETMSFAIFSKIPIISLQFVMYTAYLVGIFLSVPLKPDYQIKIVRTYISSQFLSEKLSSLIKIGKLRILSLFLILILYQGCDLQYSYINCISR